MADGLQYVAWRNNTFALHVHVGNPRRRSCGAVCDRLRPVMPELLALSANSPFLDGRNSGLHSARTQIFTKSFPRCGIPDPFGGWRVCRLRGLPARTNSIVEQTQIWWSIRPHHSFGTVELRICDAQTSAADSTALAGADHRLRRAGRARRGRGRAVRGPAAAPDRGELLARDPLRARRQADRPRARARSTRRLRRRPAARVDRPGARPSSASTCAARGERRPAPARRSPRGRQWRRSTPPRWRPTQRTYAAEEVTT